MMLMMMMMGILTTTPTTSTTANHLHTTKYPLQPTTLEQPLPGFCGVNYSSSEFLQAVVAQLRHGRRAHQLLITPNTPNNKPSQP